MNRQDLLNAVARESGTRLTPEQLAEVIDNFTGPRFTVLGDRNATVARISWGQFHATGSSKREPGDKYDPEIGRQLAVARALRNLADKVQEHADAAVQELNPEPAETPLFGFPIEQWGPPHSSDLFGTTGTDVALSGNRVEAPRPSTQEALDGVRAWANEPSIDPKTRKRLYKALRKAKR